MTWSLLSNIYFKKTKSIHPVLCDGTILNSSSFFSWSIPGQLWDDATFAKNMRFWWFYHFVSINFNDIWNLNSKVIIQCKYYNEWFTKMFLKMTDKDKDAITSVVTKLNWKRRILGSDAWLFPVSSLKTFFMNHLIIYVRILSSQISINLVIASKIT